jgi:hypothetical protein
VIAPLDRPCARSLPVHLIDDLLEIGAEQGRQDRQHARIVAIAGEDRVDVGGPLHHAHDPTEIRIVAQAEQHVLVAKAGTVAEALGVQPIKSHRKLPDLLPIEHALNDRVTVLAVVLEMVTLHAGTPLL